MAVPYPESFPPELWTAAIAVNRFGYGAEPGLLDRIAPDPQAWLLGQLENPTPTPEFAGLPNSAGRVAGFLAARAEGEAAIGRFRGTIAETVHQEDIAHTAHALSTPTPFFERLVRFWVSHFSLSSQTVLGLALGPAFEREVIRPNLSGSFVRLLTEAVRHPAMLLYLDNAGSIGPYSRAGLKGAAGMNDLLARQILGNLTRGPEADLKASDVAGLTKMLTGWSVAGPSEKFGGSFLFRPTWHEPNSKLFFNRNYPEAGVLEAEAAMDTLGRLEETARFLAHRMARYFVSDAPPADLIDAMLDGFTAGGNSLVGMARGMVTSPAAWAPVQPKVKTPEELVFSTFRLLGWGAEAAPLALRSLNALGQGPGRMPLAGGWPLAAAAWTAPAQMSERLDWIQAIARRSPGVPGRMEVADLALSVLGPFLSPLTHRRLSVTARPEEALALLLAAPEFQRR